jgi:hypothetical protein
MKRTGRGESAGAVVTYAWELLKETPFVEIFISN